MNNPKFYRIFKYNKNLIPNNYVKELESQIADSNIDREKPNEEAINKTGFTCGYPEWGILYYCVLCNMDPSIHNNILETGTNIGLSSIILAQGIKDSGIKGSLDTIEINENYYNQSKNNILKSGLSDIINQHLNNSINFLEKNKKKYQIVFLDGDHKYESVMKEFELIYKNLNNNAIVIFDNTYEIDKIDGRVNKALIDIKKKYGGNIVNFPFCSWYTPGVAIWQKNEF